MPIDRVAGAGAERSQLRGSMISSGDPTERRRGDHPRIGWILVGCEFIEQAMREQLTQAG